MAGTVFVLNAGGNGLLCCHGFAKVTGIMGKYVRLTIREMRLMSHESV